MPSNTLDHVRRTGLHIALVTFGILALELALIRWIGTQVRVFAYFNNLVLIATFLGMGLGIALGRRNPALVHWVLPALALLAMLGLASDGLDRADVEMDVASTD